MNFLAHLHLAEDTAASMIGNILPDLVRGPTDPTLHPDVLAGAANHRRVDAYTDTHPLFARTRARLRPTHGRYSGILTDLLYDHCLAISWSAYHPRPLAEFIATVHRRFDAHRRLMPRPMADIAPRMTRQNWLGMYADDDGLREILHMMSRRLAERFDRPVNLAPAVNTLAAHRDAILDDFHGFYPGLVGYVRAGASQPAAADV